MALVQVVALTLILFQGQPTTSQGTIPLHTLRRNSVICSATHSDEDIEGARNEFSTSICSCLAKIMPIYQSDGSIGWIRIAYTSTRVTQLKSVLHLGQSLHQEERECTFEVPVQELVVTSSCTVVPNKSIAKCVATSLDTSLEE